MIVWTSMHLYSLYSKMFLCWKQGPWVVMDLMLIQKGNTQLPGYKAESTSSSPPLSEQNKYIYWSNMAFTWAAGEELA